MGHVSQGVEVLAHRLAELAPLLLVLVQGDVLLPLAVTRQAAERAHKLGAGALRTLRPE